ncbi:hypothetical protein EUGRSUZ_B02385 [Eucalyptus grandis]|uniref:Uncharacterized protein n=2 Tax=Eucalyptus grandis TaxID=71139 RepID=A0ACC3LTJ8_EUCGR|nr:hypothetical protein EUGRSUZ_B02385 [Eucalyptus grandis]
MTRGISGRPERAGALWRACLSSALRTALACAVVACATLYGPAPLRRAVSLPAFSYVTVILVVTDASLGDTLRGCWLALYATAQSIGPAILSLWLIGPARLSTGTTALAVALASFVVALPGATHGTARRIALGQVVLVYVIGYIEKERIEAVMHPLHVAASTAVGALAGPLALSLPFPRTACHEIKENCKAYAENASNRLKLFAEAFLAEDEESALALISRAKCLSRAGNILLRNIKCHQESALWERVPFTSSRPYHMSPRDRLQESLETQLRGMETALTSITSFPVTLSGDDGPLKNCKLALDEHIALIMRQSKSWLSPGDSTSTVPESVSKNIIGFFDSIRKVPASPEHLPSIFFLFCMKLLHGKTTPLTSPQDDPLRKDEQSTGKESGLSHCFGRVWNEWGFKMSPKRLVPALRCSLSLGLAVLFGLMYSKEDGYWAGLPLAVSYSSAREATFKVANVKAQGTVLGSVYGVIGCFLFQRFLPVRVLSLVPWFVFCSFLRKSKMYGQAGGISAVIGALLILGRKNFGPPSEFAIARIVETFIGFSCLVAVELLMQPTRASSLAKRQLTDCFMALRECIATVTTLGGLDNTKMSNLEEKQKRVKMSVLELGKFIEEANVEPNFWFVPFHSACYSRLLGSLSKMADLLYFCGLARKFLEQELSALEAAAASSEEALDKLHSDLELYRDLASSSLKCFEEINSIKSVSLLEKQLQETSVSCDLELGKATKSNLLRPRFDEGDVEKMVGSYLQHSREVLHKISSGGDGVEAENAIKSEMVLSLGALGFCMSSLLREVREIEKAMKELVQWHNPTSQIANLHDFSRKIHALRG